MLYMRTMLCCSLHIVRSIAKKGGGLSKTADFTLRKERMTPKEKIRKTSLSFHYVCAAFISFHFELFTGGGPSAKKPVFKRFSF